MQLTQRATPLASQHLVEGARARRAVVAAVGLVEPARAEAIARETLAKAVVLALDRPIARDSRHGTARKQWHLPPRFSSKAARLRRHRGLSSTDMTCCSDSSVFRMVQR